MSSRSRLAETLVIVVAGLPMLTILLFLFVTFVPIHAAIIGTALVAMATAGFAFTQHRTGRIWEHWLGASWCLSAAHFFPQTITLCGCGPWVMIGLITSTVMACAMAVAALRRRDIGDGHRVACALTIAPNAVYIALVGLNFITMTRDEWIVWLGYYGFYGIAWL